MYTCKQQQRQYSCGLICLPSEKSPGCKAALNIGTTIFITDKTLTCELTQLLGSLHEGGEVKS
jgi:hypothetical protein